MEDTETNTRMVFAINFSEESVEGEEQKNN